MSTLLTELTAKLGVMSEKQLAALKNDVLSKYPLSWVPNPGPQTDAYFSKADVLLYGGQAGGGKSGLLGGLALTQHRRSLLMRRQYGDVKGLIDDILEKYGTRKGFSGSPPARLTTNDERIIDFGGAKTPGDEESWRGNPHDFLGIDEASQFLEHQVRFLMGWVRSVDPEQRCRTILATNPPEDPAVGQWLIKMFAPWLDETYPNPAPPGELRWVVTDENGEDKWVDGPDLMEVGGKEVRPTSRTFIPASLDDNPFLKDTNYRAQLDSLPEPLRSAIRDGNWTISHKDNPYQVIPTNWVLAAQERWENNPPDAPMCAMGVDVAQGGDNETVIAPRYDGWYPELTSVSGRDTPKGSDVAALIIKYRRNSAKPIIDVGGGYGGSVIEHLEDNGIDSEGFDGSQGSSARTADRKLGFYNKRAEAWWKFREALNPDQEGGSPITLPPDPALRADLCAPRWTLKPKGILVESKPDIISRLGRSPDKGDAVVMAWWGGATYMTHGQQWKRAVKSFFTPQVNRGYAHRKRRR